METKLRGCRVGRVPRERLVVALFHSRTRTDTRSWPRSSRATQWAPPSSSTSSPALALGEVLRPRHEEKEGGLTLLTCNLRKAARQTRKKKRKKGIRVLLVWFLTLGENPRAAKRRFRETMTPSPNRAPRRRPRDNDGQHTLQSNFFPFSPPPQSRNPSTIDSQKIGRCDK